MMGISVIHFARLIAGLVLVKFEELILLLIFFNSFMDLFKHMTEPNNFDRFTPIEALQKYVELEKYVRDDFAK